MNNKKKEAVVNIVHAVDSEGPLYESLDATFSRLKELFDIELEPSKEHLRKIQNQEINLDGKEELIAQVFSKSKLNYNDTWDKLDVMLNRIMSSDFRNKMLDSFGRGWIFNWHCIDHLDYVANPRRRDMGIHNVFDHYVQMIRDTKSYQDALHFHFHSMTTYKEAHRCSTSFVNSPHLYEILCRRIIDRKWFPKVYRAGFQTERPDSNWFLEQWMPFDISSMSIDNIELLEQQADLQRGRFGDWRLAPTTWEVYQPSHDNYQLKGHCRRYIGRALNMGTRIANIDQKEVNKAFERASNGLPTLLGITNHDFREIGADVDGFRNMLAEAKSKYHNVPFKFCECVEGFRNVIYGEDHDFGKLELDVRLEKNDNNMILFVDTKHGQIFGPQPFLAIKTRSNRYIHDNFDFDLSLKSWTYTFDQDSVYSNDIAAIGVATNDRYANAFVKVINF